MFENIITYMFISISREKLCGKVLLCFKKVKKELNKKEKSDIYKVWR